MLWRTEVIYQIYNLSEVDQISKSRSRKIEALESNFELCINANLFLPILADFVPNQAYFDISVVHLKLSLIVYCVEQFHSKSQ